ncbi:MAG: chorismate mutase [Myxococcota bacterium]
MSLETLRGKLDAIDAELIDVLARRAAVVDEIWAWKAAQGVGRVDPAREAAVRERLLARAEQLGLSRAAVSSILERIIGHSLR